MTPDIIFLDLKRYSTTKTRSNALKLLDTFQLLPANSTSFLYHSLHSGSNNKEPPSYIY